MNEDRQELLGEYDKEQSREKNLDLKTLALVYLTMLFFLGIFLPKIYIKNEIYYISRDISGLYGQYEILLEENRELRLGIESIRFKNQVLDVLFLE
ncbi:hypothetical protein JWV37_06140 [Sulfurospirillum sp. T05]|uniref:Cell division protein FtsL n=1 Tax=Sulfurospirillum tamanense TaxID=2813362 RepID=A0ABS2WRX1_9BACT|nr:hypothetical protein [Sulfurospirillum tamanensis]MBN2964352.1 hypothetical protein [Sulfurospirillum tamanensis]